MKRNLKTERRKIAKERMIRLFELAKEKEQYSKRYIILARKLSTKYHVPIPREYKRIFCRNCNTLRTSKTSRTRISGNNIVYTCLKCKYISRFRFKK